MAANRVYTPEEKLKIVLEGMSGTISVSDLCRKYDLRPARFYYWKDQLLNSAPEIFENRGRKIDEDRIRAEKDREIARLKAAVAEVVQENLEIKKKNGDCFYDICRTVMKVMERSGYYLKRTLEILRISRSWYYSQMDFSPILDGRFNHRSF